ncbi:AI-2E family transporter [Qipengyuania psychrotolerans]|uniref:AI-2E family transporter n=1 Tax=Qipengyuania psychrotolerans TaxID=2867238 RepID=A0ABX8ZCZ9_9SPHN|nr:AI-2E family transporter [Qipengyuania psychrotolerans]QZD86855.1 AI-2E family transporter [Qipengyuania psychrotolerans]
MEQARSKAIEQGGFLLFLGLITLALLIVVMPFLQPVLWAALAAIMFHPLKRWFLQRVRGSDTVAALLTLLVIFVAVILPAFWIGSEVVDEAAGLVIAFQQGQIDVAEWFEQIFSALPANIQASLVESGWGDLSALQQRAQEFAQDSLGLIAQQAIAFGGSVFGYVLAFAVGLYVSFFLLRDGKQVSASILDALPFEHSISERLAERFLGIVRATIKGSIVVGLVQGALGALTFWIVGMPSVLLFGVIMAIASLLPAVGPAIVWVPAAIYLLATGAIWEGLAVIFSGVALIGTIDNILRPILVGRDTGIPDWLILVTTLGGIALVGLSGIVIGPLVVGLFLAGWGILGEQRRNQLAD